MKIQHNTQTPKHVLTIYNLKNSKQTPIKLQTILFIGNYRLFLREHNLLIKIKRCT